MQTHVFDNSVERAKGILQLFKFFATALVLQIFAGVAVLTSAENWRSRPGTELSFEDLLLLELEFGAAE